MHILIALCFVSSDRDGADDSRDGARTNVIHLEADVHATADHANGFPDGAWSAYVTVELPIR